jgi:pimeloyl-ACP methyl ester carboxylesterase
VANRGFVETHVEADGFRVRCLTAGEGDPAIYLHGGAGLRVYRGHTLLAQQRRVVLVEMPGFGESPPNDRSQSKADLAGTICEVAAALGLQRFDLIGNAFGGSVALWLATLAPERLRSLVLIGPAAIRPGAQIAPPTSRDELNAILYAHPERLPATPQPDPAVLAKQSALVARLLGPPRDPDLEARLPALDLPVLVLFGTRDRAIPPSMGPIYRELLPNCHLVLVYDAGHEVHSDRPEAFVSVVDDFLRRPDGFLVTERSGLLAL